MGSISGDSAAGECDDSNAHEEKIFVSVRLRPLNEKELLRNEVSDWECINNTTMIFKNSLQERTMLPTAYAFDRVFGCDCPTKQVYEEAAKKVALSVLSGINSSIFAYGQTSSGKTYTMSGVTECAVDDIYDYIDKHREREFVLKFSAMEIYNESVRDLLSTDSTPLRLLDDPERGTIIEKLAEVTLRDSDHLMELLTVCEAQRQIGETTLNEMSSRSHQILRLIVESSAREYLGAANSSALTASVNFIDLAGSECASQTSSAGTRLKEGCHINRSLLTLGTVIRKLSKGRNGHVPYRDSKLTRILQNCLGGNARTAVICTMSPAHSHVEKSRNTLLFASCAKQVSTNARVNVVMSEKALVKQLQKELARLENELRNLSSLAASCDSASALKEKEHLIEKMDKEIRELTQQRDLARSHAEDLLHTGGEYQNPKPWGDYHDKRSWTDEYSASEASEIIDITRSDVASRTSQFSDRCEGLNSNKLEEPFLENSEMQFLSNDNSPRLYIDKYFGPDPFKGWEKIAQETDKNFGDNCKEVECIEIDFAKKNTIANTLPSTPEGDQDSGQSPCSSDEETSDAGSANVPRSKSCTALPMTMQKSPSSEFTEENESTSPNEFEKVSLERQDDNQGKISKIEPTPNDEDLCRKDLGSSITTVFMNEKEENIKILVEDCIANQQTCEKVSPERHDDNQGKLSKIEPTANDEDLCRKDLGSSITTDFMNEKEENIKILVEDCIANQQTCEKVSPERQDDNQGKISKIELTANDEDLCRKDLGSSITTDFMNENEENIKILVEDCIANRQTCETGLDEMVKPKSQMQFVDNLDLEAEKPSKEPENTIDDGSKTDQDIQKSASDWSTEFERQKREIIELWDACCTPLVHRTYFLLLFKGDPSDAVYMEVELRRLSFLKNTLSSGQVSAKSSRALNRERKMLSKQMIKKYSTKDREALFQKWGISLKSKNRRHQLCHRLWKDAKNMDHINESAAIVAKLVGFKDGNHAPKEMFGLSFSLKPMNLKSYSWRHSLS
ncbi:ATP binding microtubule motor family protein [Abeliophyllum distichum]|uniref:ATP binding microtubule motor family protein n=1 Tax=Abeliophyllum distichum TaxID=126358 RepID=A0ABD1SUL3_9LAMI